jgi:hypothetical protein
MSSIRHLLDPTMTLPALEVRQSAFSDPNNEVQVYRLYYRNMHMGRMVIRDYEDNLQSFRGVVVKQQGSGFGMATYAWALKRAQEQRKVFETDTSVSAQAMAIWNKLAAMGLAEVITAFVPSQEYEGVQYYAGHYAVPLR